MFQPHRPPDPHEASYPAGPTGFAPVPPDRLPFPSVVVASSNDEYLSVDRAGHLARCWGSALVPVGAGGHINTAAGFGPWPAGEQLLESLCHSGGQS